VPGDVNGDCYLMGGDITYLVNFFGGSVPPPPACCFWQCNDTLTIYYVYSGGSVIAEYDGDGVLIWNYVYGLGQRLARFNDSLLN